jgi:hypothetical protein
MAEKRNSIVNDSWRDVPGVLVAESEIFTVSASTIV